jgi:hypothetical protein
MGDAAAEITMVTVHLTVFLNAKVLGSMQTLNNNMGDAAAAEITMVTV